MALVLTVVSAFVAERCARAQCSLNSDCVPRGTCLMNVCTSDCFQDRDCPGSAPICNVNGRCVGALPDVPVVDAQTDTGDPRDVSHGPDVFDAFVPPDVFVPPDNPPPPDVQQPDVQRPDVPVVGRGQYLDGCTANGDCASGYCTTTLPRFCSMTCATDRECANGQICGGGHCQLDDTGTIGCNPTNPSAGVPCVSYCFGSPTMAHCTHTCSSARDCPAGFACSPVSGNRVCVNIEITCTDASQCVTGLGYCMPGGLGCTATCATASDCPQRLPGLPAYTCTSNAGQMVCTVPADVTGPDPLGAGCPPTGSNTCRSGACDDGNGVLPPFCNQACSPAGGCPPGYGCFPEATGSVFYLVCTPAGRSWVGDTCNRARDCVTGLCSSAGNYCTRLCSDGLCPTGMTCQNTGVAAADGTPIRLCSR